MTDKIYQYLLLIGDNTMILGHRLSELCGHGPSLETDIALTNISLDLFGQTRNYFQLAATLADNDKTEDDIAFLRMEHEYRNVLLVEQPNNDFAWVIGRQFLFDCYHFLLLNELTGSNDEQIAAIAQKSLKEVTYHLDFSSQWIKRLGAGTAVSHEKMQHAIDYLYPYTGELLKETPEELEMKELGIGPDLTAIKEDYYNRIHEVFKEATLTAPETARFQSGGKKGIHSEHMGYILAQLQYMQRAYPNMSW